jgi:hypothetical protein
MRTDGKPIRTRGFVVCATLGLFGLLGATQGGSGCGSGCSGGCDIPPPEPQKDAVFCQVTATPCALIGADGRCAAPVCNLSSSSCTFNQIENRTFCDPRFAQCQTQMAFMAGGTRVCFNHGEKSPTAACQGVCTNLPSTGGVNLTETAFPLDLVFPPNCQGNEDFSVAHGYNASSTGGTVMDYIAKGCVADGPALPGYHPNTNAVTLGGAATVQSAGNGIPAHGITISGGHVQLSAPNTSCNALQTDCPVGVTEMQMDFDDLVGDTGTIGGGGTHAMRDSHLYLDNPFLTPSGRFFPAGGGLPASFTFPLPPGIAFDAIGRGDGFLVGAAASSTQELSATINLATGQLVYDFDFTETVNGSQAELTGTATTAQVVEIGPLLDAPRSVSVDVTASCSASVTLTSTASSPLGFPVTVNYAIDTPASALNAGASATFTVAVGTHSAAITAADNQGGAAKVDVTVNVNDRTSPAFDSVPPSQTVQSCSSGSNGIHVTVPTAHNQCNPAAATVTGTITQFNGAPVSIPIVNGTVNVGPGTGTIHWVATGANGLTTPVDQTLTVIAPVTFFGNRGVNIADRSIVNGNVFSGSGGNAVVGNDSAINGNLLSTSPVQLRDRTRVTLIQTNAGLTRGNNDVIGTFLNTAPVLPTFPTINQQFTGTVAVTVNPDMTRTLGPGQYGAVTVFSRGKLVLSAGTYVFRSLDLEPQAQLITPSSTAETTQVFVQNSVIYRGRTTIASGTIAPLFLGYTGTNALTIENVFTGTIIAPNATLNLQSLNGAGVYTGEFFARQVNLSPANTTNSNPFTCH